MVATAKATTRRPPARKAAGTRAKTPAAPPRVELPHPPEPIGETFGRGPGGRRAAAISDTEADLVMLPGGFSFEPIDFDDDAEAPEPIRRPLFRYGGEWHTVLVNPPATIGLRQLSDFGRGGGGMGADIVATAKMMVAMIGEDGYEALLSVKTLDLTRYAKLTAIVQRIAMGAIEPPKDAESE